jgi:hypothetical protein
LAVLVALRLTKYKELSTDTDQVSVEIKTLATDNLSEWEVRKGLTHLVRVGLLEWHDDETVRCSSVQLKRLERFYEEE